MSVSHLFEYLRLTQTGASYSTEMTAKTVSYEGKLLEIGICRDITARVEMEPMNRSGAHGVYRRITTSLSHELRNPLSAVKLNLQILKKNHQFTDNNQRRIDIAVTEVMRLEGILKDLLDFAKPLQIKAGECRINEILAACGIARAADSSRSG